MGVIGVHVCVDFENDPSADSSTDSSGSASGFLLDFEPQWAFSQCSVLRIAEINVNTLEREARSEAIDWTTAEESFLVVLLQTLLYSYLRGGNVESDFKSLMTSGNLGSQYPLYPKLH